MHTCTHTCTYTHAHTHMHSYMHTHTHAHTYTHALIHAHTHIHTCTHTHMHSYMHTHTHAHTHTCTHTHTHTHTGSTGSSLQEQTQCYGLQSHLERWLHTAYQTKGLSFTHNYRVSVSHTHCRHLQTSLSAVQPHFPQENSNETFMGYVDQLVQ